MHKPSGHLGITLSGELGIPFRASEPQPGGINVSGCHIGVCDEVLQIFQIGIDACEWSSLEVLDPNVLMPETDLVR